MESLRDYWLSVRDAASSVAKHRKHDLHRTLKLLMLSSFAFSLGVGIFVSKLSLQAGVFTTNIFIGMFLTMFASVILLSLGLGLVHEFVSAALGGRGRYYESLTSVTFFFAAPSLGFFVASLLLFVPYIGMLLGSFIIALTFGMGLAALYRATKDLARVDMVTSYVIVSVLTISFFVMLYAALLFNAASLIGV